MYQKLKTKNNIRVILAPIEGTKTITSLILIKTGSRNESKNLNGMSHFLEHMFFKGTEKRPSAYDITVELDKIGAEFNAFTGKEATGFYVKSDSAHLETSLDVLSDMLTGSLFDEKEINKERGVILEEMKMYQDTPLYYIEDLFEQLLYGSSQLGQLIIGTEKNIKDFSRKDFVGYMKKHYNSSNLVICISGDKNILEKPDIVKKINSYFENVFSGKNDEFKKVLCAQGEPALLIHKKKTDQTHISLGVRAYGARNPKRWAVKVLSIILGGNMSSRLFMEIREKRGLAYYVRAKFDAFTDCGYLTTRAGIDKKNLESVIKIVLGEYQKIAQSGISEEDLKKAKDYLKGITILNMETSDELASFYANQELLFGEIKELEEQFKKVEAVTRADVQKVAKEIFVNEGLNLAVIGDIRDEENMKKILGF